ncbi:MAG: HlyC/CorC family transporter [Nocardiopsaceae bacterium]|nr:HlyC/CorC family transporter [Nocardiopsaceae bacterium]
MMSPAGWLVVAAVALYVTAGWCAGAQAAIARGDAEHARYASLLALIRTAAEVSAAALVTLAFTHWLRGGWQVFAASAGTLLIAGYLLVGARPRAMSKERAERTSATVARLLGPVQAALGPLPRLLDAVSGILPLGGGRDPDAPRDDDAELRGLVDFIEGRPEIEPGEQEMVRSVFELGDTIAREVMVPRTDIVFIEREKTISRAVSLALRSGFSRIPVVGESTDDVVGIAYLKDIVSWEHEHPGQADKVPVERIMRPATYVPESKPVDELLRQMQSQRIHVAVVIDEYGGTAGLVTIEDILEEIVGEIADEYDDERAPVEWLADRDKARVTARLPVTELGELFGVTIEAEDVETVGGLLAHELGRVPIAGSVAEVAGLRLTAENLAGRRNKLGTVLAERRSPPDEETV